MDGSSLRRNRSLVDSPTAPCGSQDTALWIFNFGLGSFWFDAMKETKGLGIHWQEDPLREALGGILELLTEQFMLLPWLTSISRACSSEYAWTSSS